MAACPFWQGVVSKESSLSLLTRSFSGGRGRGIRCPCNATGSPYSLADSCSDPCLLRVGSPLTSPLCSVSGSQGVLHSPTSCSASLPLTPLPQRKLASAQTCTVVATPFHEERRRTRAKVRSELPSSPLLHPSDSLHTHSFLGREKEGEGEG